MADFLTNLSRFRQSNPFIGAVQGASARLLASQGEATRAVLDNVNKKIQNLKEGELLNRDEQLDLLSKDPEGADAISSVEQMAKGYQELQSKLTARGEAYSDIYNEAMQNLAFIGGDQANRAVQSLQMQKGDELARLDRKSKEALQAVQFENALQQNANAQLNYRIQYKDWVRKEDSLFLADLIQESDVFKRLHKGRQTFVNRQSYLDANRDLSIKKKQIMDDVAASELFRSRFGDTFTDGAMSTALDMVLQANGVEIAYQEQKPDPMMQKLLAKQTMEERQDYALVESELERLSGIKIGDAHGIFEFLTSKVPRLTQINPDVTPEEWREIYDFETGKVNYRLAEKYFVASSDLPEEEARQRYQDWITLFAEGGEYDGLYNQYKSLYSMVEGRPLFTYGQDGQVNIDGSDTTKYLSKITGENLNSEAYNALPKDVRGQVDSRLKEFRKKFGRIPKNPKIIHNMYIGGMMRERDKHWSPEWIEDAYRDFFRTGELTQEVADLIWQNVALPQAEPGSTGTVWDEIMLDEYSPYGYF